LRDETTHYFLLPRAKRVCAWGREGVRYVGRALVLIKMRERGERFVSTPSKEKRELQIDVLI